MSSHNDDDRPSWADPPDERSDDVPETTTSSDPQPDDAEATTSSEPPEKRYDCPYCGESFTGDSAIQRRAEHIADVHPDETTTSGSDDTASDSGGPSQSTLSGLANLVGGLSDKETGDYRGWLSTSAEVGVFLFGIMLGSLLAHGVVSVEVLATLGGLGLVGAGAAARKKDEGTRDGIQSNIEHYVAGIILGFLVVFLPHEIVPPDWSVDDLFHLFGRHAH